MVQFSVHTGGCFPPQIVNANKLNGAECNEIMRNNLFFSLATDLIFLRGYTASASVSPN